MNFFEQELRRFMDSGTGLKSTAANFTGRVGFYSLADGRRARLEFIPQGTIDRFEALRITILRLDTGEIDHLDLIFRDYMKPQKSTCMPSIWGGCNTDWRWTIQPLSSEIEAVAKAAKEYIHVFA